MQNHNDVQLRSLRREEMNIPSDETASPLVIEPGGGDGHLELAKFLAANSRRIMEHVVEHGAVLFRGFNIGSEAAFEEAIVNITGMQPMDCYLLAEQGRTLVEGTRYVFHTNKVYKTGGTLDFTGFHTENYYSPDVPGFICFCCIQPSKFGGETALINMAKVYRDLPDSLKRKLEAERFFVGWTNVEDIARRYGVSSQIVKEVLSQFGVSFEGDRNDERVTFTKPAVCEHPVTSQPVLLANISLELPQVHARLRRLLMREYYGWNWAYHRVVWRFPVLRYLPKLLVPSFRTSARKYIARWLKSRISGGRQERDQIPATAENVAIRHRLANVFSTEEAEQLAAAMRAHLTSFTWNCGDVVIVDNLQMAHGGMPGFGRRTLRALICNPVRMNLSASGPGREKLTPDASYRSIAATIGSRNGSEQQLSVK